MAGGASKELSVLSEVRAEAAIPFGGKFRLIDFPLSNCVNSDIYNVAVLTQYKPRSLHDHIGTGKPWDLDLATGGLRLLHPYQGGRYGGWQMGTADAVRRNLDFLQQQTEPLCLILAGDHVNLMDYRPMIRQHLQTGASLTVGARRVSPHEAHRFGMLTLDADDEVVDFEEKPRRPRGTMASMGIYVFNRLELIEILASGSENDFGRDILPRMVRARQGVYAYTFPGYWADIGNVQAYWEANMSLLAENPALEVYNPDWVVHTRSEQRAPVKLGPRAQVAGSILSNGCVIEGTVERSVLSPGVRVQEGAVVRDSVILYDVVIEAGAVVDYCIIDENTLVGREAQVGHGEDNTPNKNQPESLNTGLTLVGENCHLPEKLVIGRNVVVHPNTSAEAFGKKRKVASGSSVGVDSR
jgi:glucose-1-phosphate adenylyltransferase